MSMHWVKLFAPNIWLNIRGMGWVGLISPLEFLQLQLVIGFLDLLVQSAQIFQLIYPSIPLKCASLIRGERPRPPVYFYFTSICLTVNRVTWGIAFGGVSFGEELVLECVEDDGVVLLLLPRWQFRGGDPTAAIKKFKWVLCRNRRRAE